MDWIGQSSNGSFVWINYDASEVIFDPSQNNDGPSYGAEGVTFNGYQDLVDILCSNNVACSN